MSESTTIGSLSVHHNKDGSVLISQALEPCLVSSVSIPADSIEATITAMSPGEIKPLPSLEFGAFLWRVDRMTPEEVVTSCKRMGLTRVLPKVMNKRGKAMFTSLIRPLVVACHAAGIKVIGWAYMDDIDGVEDAQALLGIKALHGLDGVIANMERELIDGKTSEAKARDQKVMEDVLGLLTGSGDSYVGFSSFRRRDYFPFPKAVFEDLRDKVTYMPQCYNLRDTNASDRVTASAESWLKWDIRIRMTLGAFKANKSQSGKFGSDPLGLALGMRRLEAMSYTNPNLDGGCDFWALEQIEDDMADVIADSIRRATS